MKILSRPKPPKVKLIVTCACEAKLEINEGDIRYGFTEHSTRIDRKSGFYVLCPVCGKRILIVEAKIPVKLADSLRDKFLKGIRPRKK